MLLLKLKKVFEERNTIHFLSPSSSSFISSLLIRKSSIRQHQHHDFREFLKSLSLFIPFPVPFSSFPSLPLSLSTLSLLPPSSLYFLHLSLPSIFLSHLIQIYFLIYNTLNNKSSLITFKQTISKLIFFFLSLS